MQSPRAMIGELFSDYQSNCNGVRRSTSYNPFRRHLGYAALLTAVGFVIWTTACGSVTPTPASTVYQTETPTSVAGTPTPTYVPSTATASPTPSPTASATPTIVMPTPTDIAKYGTPGPGGDGGKATPTPTEVRKYGTACDDKIVTDADIKNSYELTLPFKPCTKYEMFLTYVDMDKCGKDGAKVYFRVESGTEIAAPVSGKTRTLVGQIVLITEPSGNTVSVSTNKGKLIVKDNQNVGRGDIIALAGEGWAEYSLHERTAPPVPGDVNVGMGIYRDNSQKLFNLVEEPEKYFAGGLPKFYIQGNQ